MIHPLSPDVDQIAGVEIEAARPNADFIALGPLGRSAALYHRRENLIETLAGLPQRPYITSRIDLRPADGVLTALAVDDTGRSVLAGLSQRESGALFSFAAGARGQLLTSVARPSYVAFVPQSLSFVAADYGADQILWGRDASVAGDVVVLAGPADRIARPIAVESSRDGTRFLVLNQDRAELIVIDRVSGVSSLSPCRCQPTTLMRLRDADSFHLLQGDGPTSTVLRLSTDTPTGFDIALAPREEKTRQANQGAVVVRGRR
jgi:hypothetical protein